MPEAGFEPAIPVSERPQTYTLDRADIEIGRYATPYPNGIGRYATPYPFGIGRYATPYPIGIGRYATPYPIGIGRYATPYPKLTKH